MYVIRRNNAGDYLQHPGINRFQRWTAKLQNARTFRRWATANKIAKVGSDDEIGCIVSVEDEMERPE